MTLTRWYQKPKTTVSSSIEDLWNLHDEFNRLLHSSWNGVNSQAFNTWAPALDLFENKDQFTVRVELPGLKKEEINISLHDGALTISGEKKSEETQTQASNYREERIFGRFQRSIALPSAVARDGVKATYRDGILTVELPKAEEAKPKQIAVNIQ
jgi:HSP20 family protein